MVKTTITLQTPIFLSSNKPVYTLVVEAEEKLILDAVNNPIIADVEGEEIHVPHRNIAGISYANIADIDSKLGETKGAWRDKMPDVLSIIKDKDETTS